MSSYRDLRAWREAMDFSIKIYQTTEYFPKAEQLGLTIQLRRAAISIPSNLAEGQKRGHSKEFVQFCRVAYGSAAELDTQLELARKLQFINEDDYEQLALMLKSISQKLNRLIKALDANSLT